MLQRVSFGDTGPYMPPLVAAAVAAGAIGASGASAVEVGSAVFAAGLDGVAAAAAGADCADAWPLACGLLIPADSAAGGGSSNTVYSRSKRPLAQCTLSRKLMNGSRAMDLLVTLIVVPSTVKRSADRNSERSIPARSNSS